MSQGGSNKRVSNSLLALSSAAILAVYTAGYTRTRSAADRFAVQSQGRRPAHPVAHVSAAAVLSPAAILPATAPASDPKPASDTEPLAATPAKPAPAPSKTPTTVISATPAPSRTESTPAPIAEPAPAEPKVEQKAEVAPIVAAVPQPPPPAAPAVAAAPAPPVWKDGTYTGWGTCRHGDIQASVVVEGGRISSATIAQCNTRYSCSIISKLPPEVAERQSPDVDYVSGATQSSDAFYYAVLEALGKAK